MMKIILPLGEIFVP